MDSCCLLGCLLLVWYIVCCLLGLFCALVIWFVSGFGVFSYFYCWWLFLISGFLIVLFRGGLWCLFGGWCLVVVVLDDGRVAVAVVVNDGDLCVLVTVWVGGRFVCLGCRFALCDVLFCSAVCSGCCVL